MASVSERLKDPDWRVRHEAALAAYWHVDDPREIAVFVNAIQDPDAWVARSAVHAVVAIATRCDRPNDTLLPLLRALDDDRSAVRWAAAESLCGEPWQANPRVQTRLARFYTRYGSQAPALTFRHYAEDGSIKSEDFVDE